MAGQDGDGNEATDEENVEKDGSEGEEGDATEAAGKDHSSDSVYNSNAGDALNSLLPSGYASVAIGLLPRWQVDVRKQCSSSLTSGCVL